MAMLSETSAPAAFSPHALPLSAALQSNPVLNHHPPSSSSSSSSAPAIQPSTPSFFTPSQSSTILCSREPSTGGSSESQAVASAPSTVFAPSQPSYAPRTSSAVSFFRSFFSSMPSASPTSSSTSPAPTGVSSAPPHSSSAARPSHPANHSPKNWHWPQAATERFNQLAEERNFEWKYEDFVAVWPVQEFGYVDKVRFWNKCRIEKDRREGRSRVKAQSKSSSTGNKSKRQRVH